MQNKVLDQAAFFTAVSKISVCLAMAFWLFACVRLLKGTGQTRRCSDQLAVISFALQLLLPIAAMVLVPREMQGAAEGVLFSLEASLSIMTIIWASGSGSMIGGRTKIALLLWIFGIVFALGSPTMTP